MGEENRDGPLKGALVKAGEKYRDRTSLRAAVQAIPYVGGPIDTLLSGHAGKIQEERFRSFMDDLDTRLRRLEGLGEVEGDERFFDFMLNVFDGVLRARSEEKRARFAQIVANQVQGGRDWEDADTAVRLLGDLSDIHAAILREASNAPLCGLPFENMRVISLAAQEIEPAAGNRPVMLFDALSDYSPLALKMACSELTARGLLHDEGIGRWSLGALQYLVPTELTSWFLKHLSNDA